MSHTMHKGAGHRGRLRKRFLQGGLDSFLDYEIVELLLTLGTPRKDCKSIAKVAIKTFCGLRGTLDATSDELQKIDGIGPNNIFGLKLFQAVSERYTKDQIPTKHSFSSPKAVVNYLREKIGKEKKEHFMSIMLDSSNCLIDIHDISIGILNASLVHPREVFEPAIRHLAANIILAHNHPSGNLEPSADDIQITQRLSHVGEITGINVLDHLIITINGYSSLREKGLM